MAAKFRLHIIKGIGCLEREEYSMKRLPPMNDFGPIVCILLITCAIISFITFAAHKEAEQFNRFSSTKITWWDAMWADYRILPTGR